MILLECRITSYNVCYTKLLRALLLKERYAGSVTALTMGPSQAAKALKEALAMGCDEAVLLSDRRFGGSDTWATSYTLAQAIRKIGRNNFV